MDTDIEVRFIIECAYMVIETKNLPSASWGTQKSNDVNFPWIWRAENLRPNGLSLVWDQSLRTRSASDHGQEMDTAAPAENRLALPRVFLSLHTLHGYGVVPTLTAEGDHLYSVYWFSSLSLLRTSSQRHPEVTIYQLSGHLLAWSSWCKFSLHSPPPWHWTSGLCSATGRNHSVSHQ